MKTVKLFCAVALLMGVAAAALGQQPSEDEGQQPSRDQIRTAVQGICPVTGRKLGTHGDVVKVKIGEEEIFLCCKGCTSGKVAKEHWATIHANFAKAQGICPVMKKALPKNPKWTIVQGQIVYVCCPPCIKKIEADPATHLQKVDELYRASLNERQKSQ